MKDVLDTCVFNFPKIQGKTSCFSLNRILPRTFAFLRLLITDYFLIKLRGMLHFHTRERLYLEKLVLVSGKPQIWKKCST